MPRHLANCRVTLFKVRESLALACRYGRMWFLAAVVASLAPSMSGLPQSESSPTPARKESDPSRALSTRELENVRAATRLFGYVRFFHPCDQARGVKDWTAVAIDLLEAAEPATDASDLAARLGVAIAPLAPSLQIWAGTETDAPALPAKPTDLATLRAPTKTVWWKHYGAGTVGTIPGNAYRSLVAFKTLDIPVTDTIHASTFTLRALGGGVMCRLPVVIYADAEGSLPRASSTPDKYATIKRSSHYAASDRSTRMAGVAILWTIMQHFYPYFDVVKTDWPAALDEALKAAATDAGPMPYLFTLSTLVGKLHDGHGHVSHDDIQPASRLPIALAWAGQDLVVTQPHESVADRINVGDAIVAINDRSVEQWYESLSPWISAATEGWRRTRMLRLIVADYSSILAPREPAPTRVALHLRRPDGSTYDLAVDRVSMSWNPKPAFDQRPELGAEVAPGIVYFNLDGTDTSTFRKALPKLEQAKGLIFDLRGYPGEAAKMLLPLLSDSALQSARWNVPIVTKPDGEGWIWDERGRWNLPPQQPRLRQPVVFLTGGGAISYAESIMGIVEAYKLGEIVGATTAGTNGNVNPIALPGGFRVSWTGMRVLKHDGSTHHGIGIAPTINAAPTIRGIAERRDEVLEMGIEVVKTKLDAASDAGPR